MRSGNGLRSSSGRGDYLRLDRYGTQSPGRGDRLMEGKLTRIKITIGDLTVEAELFETECARAIIGKLPIESTPQEWGDEFYFTIPVKMGLDETATTDVNVGDIGYWPPGRAMAIFFGPTPASSGEKPVPASKVNIVGRILGNPKILRKAKGASRVRLERA